VLFYFSVVLLVSLLLVEFWCGGFLPPLILICFAFYSSDEYLIMYNFDIYLYYEFSLIFISYKLYLSLKKSGYFPFKKERYGIAYGWLGCITG
jgi:hypothetical protein